jgi:hypothetical protein
MTFEPGKFIQSALVFTAALSPVVLALVTWYGKLGVKGKLQLVLSMLTGFILGIAVQMAVVGFPRTYPDYIALLIFGLIPGSVASGVYETGKGIGERVAKAVG